MRSTKLEGRRAIVIASALTFVLFVLSSQARAETVHIVALGASNTYAQAVSTSQAWPAKLEAMLKAKGYDVSVSVKSVSVGDASQIYAAAQSIPSGTKVVVFDAGGGNSKDRGIDPKAYRTKTVQAIKAQGATPIFVSYKQIVGPEGTSAWIANDPHHHFTAASHTRVAASVLPRIIAAIGKK
jgi:acyl-CoA thioesterase-1